MRVAATKRPNEMTAEDRRALAAYSGWGGLSIEGASKQFPLGFPAPEPRGLIHEYYTPTRVAREVARVIRPLVDDLPDDEGVVLALEPSAGIGRFVQAAAGDGFDPLRWLVCEWSELSARMLQALRPEIPIYNGPFERWVREHGPEYAGRLGIVLANPPYGARGVSITEDPDRAYREKNAYAYFLRRALDLLAPNGLGVFLVPSGFLTGASAGLVGLREKVLKRHHLSAAYRLPSAIFPGAMLVTDLLLFRARGGELDQVDEGDRFVLEARYFREHPDHVLGTEVGKDAGDDDQTAKPRWGYQVVGTFEHLPDLVERPICGACTIARDITQDVDPALLGPEPHGDEALRIARVGASGDELATRPEDHQVLPLAGGRQGHDLAGPRLGDGLGPPGDPDHHADLGLDEALGSHGRPPPPPVGPRAPPDPVDSSRQTPELVLPPEPRHGDPALEVDANGAERGDHPGQGRADQVDLGVVPRLRQAQGEAPPDRPGRELDLGEGEPVVRGLRHPGHLALGVDGDPGSPTRLRRPEVERVSVQEEVLYPPGLPHGLLRVEPASGPLPFRARRHRQGREGIGGDRLLERGDPGGLQRPPGDDPLQLRELRAALSVQGPDGDPGDASSGVSGAGVDGSRRGVEEPLGPPPLPGFDSLPRRCQQHPRGLRPLEDTDVWLEEGQRVVRAAPAVCVGRGDERQSSVRAGLGPR
jgi:hypothetical protein